MLAIVEKAGLFLLYSPCTVEWGGEKNVNLNCHHLCNKK